MASASREAVETQIDRLCRNGTLTSLSDAQLLDRYLSTRDEAAFEALVNMHGPMVLGLCRRMLRDPSDIDDAFQATFLVLVRKAPAIRDRGLLANWLYGVAYRVAVRSRGNLLRKRERERSLAEIEMPAMSAHDHAEEIPPALDQELNRLPSRYSVPLVLCYLKGLTHDQAAEELRCPVGTVRSRLSRGRNLLKRRLTARGYAPSAGLLGCALPVPAVPDSLVRGTIESVARFAAGQGAAAAMAASAVETLAEGVLMSMISTNLKAIVLSLLTLALTSGAVVGVVLLASNPAGSEPPAPPPAAQPKTPEPKNVALSPPRKIKPGDWVRIEVLEALPGRPISGIRDVRPDGTISLGWYGDLQVAGLDRNQIKIKVINHLRKFLTDEVLGLLEMDPETGGPRFESNPKGETIKRIKPIDSDRVFVDDSIGAYAPSPVEKRLERIEETLNELSWNLVGLSRQVNIGPYNQSLAGMSQLLAAQRANLEAQQKLAAAGLASLADLAELRSAFEASKKLIPQLISNARTRLESAKIVPAIDEKGPKYKARLRTAQSRLDEKKRLFKEGKIPEEEVLDAEGEFQLLNSNGDDQTSAERRRASIREAQSDLEVAEQLKSKYLDAPEKPATKGAGPK